MSEDWVAEYMSYQRDERSDKESNLLVAKTAIDAAPRVFRALSDRIKRDITAYQDMGGDRLLQYHFVPSTSFVVRRSQLPVVELKVDLKGATIEYSHYYKRDDTEDGNRTEGHLRIEADLSGNVQMKQGGVSFVDESEVSAALLKPLFDHLR